MTIGSAVAALAHWLLDPAAMAAWGWRLPFLAGILVGGFGLWMRRGMVETSDFQALKESGDIDKNPIVEAVRSAPGQIIRVAAMVVMLGGGFYMLFVWWPTYLTKIIQPPVPHALLVNTIAMAAMMAVMVVPILAPMVIGNAASMVRIPAATRGTNKDVVTELLWTTIVKHSPAKNPKKAWRLMTLSRMISARLTTSDLITRTRK